MAIKFTLPEVAGESILISTEDYVLLVDGGMPYTFTALQDTLFALNRKIDLMVLTHTDEDHIGGLLRLIESGCYPEIGEIWFNTSEKIKLCYGDEASMDTSCPQATSFFKLIQKKDIKHFDKAITVEDFPDTLFLTEDLSLRILSPTRKLLKKFFKEWNQKEFGRENWDSSGSADWHQSYDCLLEQDLGGKGSNPNGASLAFLLTYKKKNFLLTGDAFAETLVASIKSLGYSKAYPLTLELFNLSHHGSSKNITRELIDITDAKNYLVCFRGMQSKNLPNKKTLVHILDMSDEVVKFLFDDSIEDVVVADLGSRLNYEKIHEIVF